jgi:hypothetical protein
MARLPSTQETPVKNWLWMLPALAVLLGACRGSAENPTAAPTVAEPAADTAAPPATVAEPATDAVVEDGVTATPDATLEAVVAGFELPIRGDRDAPLVIYEFSDYL